MTLLDEIEAHPSLQWKPPPPPIPPSTPSFKLRGSGADKISNALKLLRDAAQLSPATLLEEILTDKAYEHHADKFFGHSGATLRRILDAMVADERGKQIFREWVQPTAIEIACETVTTEMDSMVKALSTASSIKRLTPKFLRAWNLNDNVVQPAKEFAPNLVKILFSASNTDRGLKSHSPMSLFWWKNGASRESLEVLKNLGLSKCFASVQTIIASVADYCIEDSCIEARDPNGFMANWDNVNISTSDFVEQRTEGPTKVQSGTYAILYRIRNPNPRAMVIGPLLARAEIAPA
ncbi:hypothetical protein B0H12DRAFT_1069914 [Mycena haematopus]|nr:hypothetical protein B0H12DRAFT_1069914 [Mycena haematopus]